MRLIDADMAIEELTDRSHQAAKRVGIDSPFWEGLVIARRIVNNLPTIQPEPKWIPVSERLPEEDGKYMVTIHGYGWNGKTFTSVSVAECIGKRWVGNNGVIAWMPLPEPYQKGAKN